MLLQFTNGEAFATGATLYAYRPVTSKESLPRIILPLLIGNLEVLAFVDTGGVYLLCSPEIAWQLRLYPEDSLGALQMLFRGVSYFGHLHRIPLTFLPHEGALLTVEVTAFVPQQHAGDEWPSEFPCILGMSGCLERLRFAIDPFTDTFYFGEFTGG
jgi:hypothetical protein